MKRIFLLGMALTSILFTGCTAIEIEANEIEPKIQKRPTIIQTYDEDSNIIDMVKGTSVGIGQKNVVRFFSIGDDMPTRAIQSNVLNITVDGKGMIHNGSSLIAHDQELENVFETYLKSVDIKSLDRSVPFVNRMLSTLDRAFTGKEMVILVRSQSGKPLATFIGDLIAHDATPIENATVFLVDGKKLFIYRCDFTIYELGVLQ